MGDKNEDHTIQEHDERRVHIASQTMNGHHSTRGPYEVESETAECSEEGLTLRVRLKLASILKGWVAKEVIALSRLAIPIVS